MSTDLMPYPALVKDEPIRFADAFTALAASKNTPADELKIRAYAKVLADSPIEGTEQAAKRLMATASPYLPPAGEWRSLADTIGLNAYGEQAMTFFQRFLGAGIYLYPAGHQAATGEPLSAGRHAAGLRQT